MLKKNLTREKIFEVAGYLKKYKIMSYGGFIMGFPEDTNETLKNTYDMINELQLDKTAVGVAIPLPGTALFNQVVKDKLFVDPPDLDDLWKTPIGVDQSGFVIKPYFIKKIQTVKKDKTFKQFPMKNIIFFDLKKFQKFYFKLL